jgi:hypothetical protein
MLDDGIREAHRKVENGRVYDPENEKVRQGWLRTLGYLAGQYRQLMKDKELDDLREEVELLKEAQGVSANSNGTPDAVGFADRDDERPEWFDRVSASAGSEPVTGSPDDGGESGGDP